MMKNWMPYLVNNIAFIIVAVSVLLTSLPAIADTNAPRGLNVIDGDTWSRPRSAERVSQLPAVRLVVKAWLDRPEYLVEIAYPGGEEGSLWASELKDWLISLGIASNHIQLQPGHPVADQMALFVVKP